MELDGLFEPYTIKSTTLRNRFVMSPMQRHRPPDFIPRDELVEYHRERARGGIGFIVTQGTTMDHPTTASPFARLFPPAYDGWRRIAEAVREEGGHISMQLWHEGATRADGCSPSGLTVLGEPGGRPFTGDEVLELIDVYAHSAKVAQELGFSGVELHCGATYLLGQFLSPVANQRDDEWGGDPEKRMRFLLAVIRAVRAAVRPDFLVGMRMSLLRPPSEGRLCHTPEELKAFLDQVVEAGIDLFNTSTGQYWAPEFEGSDLSLAGWIKNLTGKTVITNGSVGLDADLRSIINGATAHSTAHEGFGELRRRFDRGDFDLVSLGRTILTDPEYINKLREGRYDEMIQSLTYAQVSSARPA